MCGDGGEIDGSCGGDVGGCRIHAVRGDVGDVEPIDQSFASVGGSRADGNSKNRRHDIGTWLP